MNLYTPKLTTVTVRQIHNRVFRTLLPVIKLAATFTTTVSYHSSINCGFYNPHDFLPSLGGAD